MRIGAVTSRLHSHGRAGIGNKICSVGCIDGDVPATMHRNRALKRLVSATVPKFSVLGDAESWRTWIEHKLEAVGPRRAGRPRFAKGAFL
jgi:hypothetical protein